MAPCSQGLSVYAYNLCTCWALSLPARRSSQGNQSKHVFNDTCFPDEDIGTVNSPVWNRMLWYVHVKCACSGGDSGQIRRNVSCKFKTVHVTSFYDNVNWYIIIVNVTGFYAFGVTEKRYLEWFLSQRRDVSCARVAWRLFWAKLCQFCLFSSPWWRNRWI